MQLIVDRIEEGMAVCEREDMSTVALPLSVLPSGTAEGSVIIVDDDGNYRLDRETEKLRRSRMLEMQKKLFGGDD